MNITHDKRIGENERVERRSVVQRAMGERFTDLHPLIQRQYALTSESGLCCVGEGVMTRIWRGPFYVAPFLALGSKRQIMFPETGTDVPFRVENYAYVDSFGCETLTWVRWFGLPQENGVLERRFDETLVYSETRGRAVVYAGDHQHLAVDLELSAGPNGEFRLRTRGQRIYEGIVGFPFPGILSGHADVEEWYDEPNDLFRVKVRIASRLFGPIFGYDGCFRLEWKPVQEIPTYARPIREERQE